MQNQPIFYSLVEFHEVPWQKNRELPVFCFSLLLACTWGIICSWKLERKQPSHTIITSHKLILLQFPIIFTHPVFTLKMNKYCWGKVKNPQNHKDANTWKLRQASSDLAAWCFRILCTHLFPLLRSYTWECGLSHRPLQTRCLGFLSPLQAPPGKKPAPIPSTCPEGGKLVGIFVCTAECLCFCFWLTS